MRRTTKVGVGAAIATVIVIMAIGQAALGGLSQNTIDPTATLREGGRKVLVTGPIACTTGEHLQLRITVNQRATGAVAEGFFRAVCTGSLQPWSVDATTWGREVFQPADGTACALAMTSQRGTVTDAKQWCKDIILVVG